jgi:hypothetical protein
VDRPLPSCSLIGWFCLEFTVIILMSKHRKFDKSVNNNLALALDFISPAVENFAP